MKYNLEYKTPPKYQTYLKRAAKNFPNHEFINPDEFELLTKKSCHYCGKKGPNGIDRVNNLVGYMRSNCVPCCKHCNYVKGNLSIENFLEWKNRFVNHQSKIF